MYIYVDAGRTLAIGAVLASCLGAACSDANGGGGAEGGAGGGPSIFGNSGGAIEQPRATGGSAGSNLAGTPGATCAQVPTANSDALLDDFEDGNTAIRGVPQRVGYWTIFDDLTGGSRTPSGNLELEQGGVPGSDFGIHVTAAGFTKWGISVGTSLNFTDDAQTCPLNASGFSGIIFHAKGPSRIYVQVPVPDIIPQEYGGSCDEAREVCFNSHKALIKLTDEWARYEVPWRELLQDPSWGKHLAFDPRAILGINFVVLPADMPAELWIDDVGFLSGEGGAAP